VIPAASPSVDALGLFVDRSGRLFFKSADAGFWETDGTRPWQRVGDRTRRLQSLAESDDGTAWAVWGGALVDITGGRRDARASVPDRDVAVFRRAGGGLWLGIGNAVARFLDGRLVHLDVRPPIERRVSVVASASDGGLWVAAGNDVSRLDARPDGTWQRRSLPLGLEPQVIVRTLETDSEGSLWIGTDGRGLYRVNRPPTRRVAVGAALAQVSALAPDGRGGAFVGSGCRGLFHVGASDEVHPVRLEWTAGEASFTDDGCDIALAAGPADTVWARAGPNLFRIDSGSPGLTRVPLDVPHDEGPIAAGADGALWVVSRQGTVHLLAPPRQVVRQLSFPSPLTSASVAPDGALWVGGDGQVFRVRRDATAFERYGAEENVPRGLVRDVLVERDGTAWIATYGGGIGRLRAGRVTRLSVVHGLPDNSVTRILDDGRGRLWVSTNRGIAVCEKAQLNDVADGRLGTFAPVVFGPERGVAEANFGQPAGFADPGGVLWFGTIDGAVRIDATAFPFNGTPPVVSVHAVSADDRPLSPGAVVQVPALTSRVRLDVTASSLLYPELIRFRFRVEGIDPGWVDVGPQRSLTWTPPGPGWHRITVEARNEDGIWSATPAVIDLDVMPAWWQRTTVRGAGALAAVLFGFAAFRWRVRRIERRHAEQLRRIEEQRLADERVASLRQQLEHVSRVALAGELAASLAHEVRQPIGAIVNNAEAGRRHLQKYMQRPGAIEALFGEIVADGMRASEIVGGMRSFLRPHEDAWSRVDLSRVVRDMLPLVRRELQDNRVEVVLALHDDLPRVDAARVQLGQVVVNLVMNACEALVGVDGPRRVTIETCERDGRVELAVIDNGPGPPRDVASRIFEPFVSTKPDGLGMGLAICRSLAETHGGHLAADVPPAGGFRVVLSLPAAKEPPATP
jgi:signal transduction histidine kinase